MKISTILDHIDSGYMALPKFQRGYVWNRDQVRRLMDSLYRRHPVGSLLVWVTESEGAPHRGDDPLPPGQVKLLLDGQQRMTTMYGIIRGKPLRFFDGNVQVFTDLYFNLDTEEFSFYMPKKMKDDPLWVDVTRLMVTSIGPFIQEIGEASVCAPRFPKFMERRSVSRAGARSAESNASAAREAVAEQAGRRMRRFDGARSAGCKFF